jgi:SAM-dependent methyltransferase
MKVITDPIHGYWRVDPLPTQEELDEYYAKQFYQDYKGFNDSALENQDDEFNEVRFGLIARRLRVKYPKIIEYGCGYGAALKYFQKWGAVVGGWDPNKEAMAHLEREGIYTVDPSDEDIGHVVLLLNVLEHLRKPLDMLKQIREANLLHGGQLIVEVPNDFNVLQAIANKEHRLRRWWVSPPGHLNYFTVESISSLIQKAGYKITARECSFPMEMFLLMGENYVKNRYIGSICHKKRVAFERAIFDKSPALLARLYEGFADMGIGRQVTIYAEA